MIDSGWHRFPKDAAWRQVHLAHVEGLLVEDRAVEGRPDAAPPQRLAELPQPGVVQHAVGRRDQAVGKREQRLARHDGALQVELRLQVAAVHVDRLRAQAELLRDLGVSARGLQDGVERALLLPVDPDASAETLRTKLGATATYGASAFF